MTALDFITAIIIIGCCIMGIFFLLPAPNACPFNSEDLQYLIQFTVLLNDNSSVIPGAGLTVNAEWCSGQSIGITDENGTVDLLMYKSSQYHTVVSNDTYYNVF